MSRVTSTKKAKPQSARSKKTTKSKPKTTPTNEKVDDCEFIKVGEIKVQLWTCTIDEPKPQVLVQEPEPREEPCSPSKQIWTSEDNETKDPIASKEETKRDPLAKRDTVIRIVKPKDEKKEVFKKMLKLNYEADNSLARKPVYAWENSYRDITEDQEVRMMCVTWNFGENAEDCHKNVHELIKRDVQHDIYVIALQNCADFAKFEKTIMSLLGTSYVTVSREVYRKLGISLIWSKKVKDLLNVSRVWADHYRDGNRTTKVCAVAAKIAGKTYAFANWYVSPKVNLVKKDEGQITVPAIVQIDQTLEMTVEPFEEEKAGLTLAPIKQHLISETFDVCVFMGGFNTPIVGSASGVNSMITSNLFESLKQNDKMHLDFREYSKSKKSDSSLVSSLVGDDSRKQDEHKLFGSYNEAEILFAPTSIITPFSDNFDTTVTNISDISLSGWTDRILWTWKPKEDSVAKQDFFKQMSYDSNNLIKSSQNRPVFSQFAIRF